MAKQVVATGIKAEEYEFVDADKNHLFTIRFNPADINIAKRYDEVVDWLNNVSIPEDADTDELFKLTDELEQKIDYLLGIREGSDVCSFMNPFSPLEDGRLYIEVVMDEIGKLIESELDLRTKKYNARMKKYTGKYENK